MGWDETSRELLLAAVQPPQRSSPPRFARLAAEISDWDLLIETARQHRIASLLYSRISASGVSCPPDVEAELRAEYERNLVRSLANASELIALLDEFKAAGIRALPFKGVVLAA